MNDQRNIVRAAAPLVAAHGLGVVRDGHWLVRHVDLALHPGEILTVIGPNGSGKSTTAKALLGLIRPDEGEVRRAPGVRVGYVPQQLALDWTLPLTARRLLTLTGRHPRREVDRALEQVGIPHLADARIQTMSGGEFQRALLARAIVRRPQLLVLDEPVQGVDFNGEIALYDLIRQVRDQLGCGILLVSHDLHIVMSQTDTVLCLNRHVCCHGTPQAVASNPEYRRLFGPRAAETLAIYPHHHDHVHRADGTVVHLPPPEGS
jgi:zinc transport system ATP-binding protein